MTTHAPLLGRCHFWSNTMRDFPKMLYLGTTQSYEHKSAQNEDHEVDLRELGFVDFAELESEQARTSGGMIGSASSGDFKNAFVPVEQFDAVSEELVQKELQLNVAQTERDQFKADLDKALDENQQLQQIIDSYQPESTTQTPPVSPDYNSMTSDQLRVILDEKGIKYLARDNKDTLIDLLR